MAIKTDIKAISRAINIASGGFFATVYKAISDTYQDYMEEQLSDLINDLINNGIEEEELIKFLEDNTNKRFVQNIIKKNIYSDNRIQTYVLAKLWEQQIKNGTLNFYENSLFYNINSLTNEDLKNYITIFEMIMQEDRGSVCFLYLVSTKISEKITKQKPVSLEIILSARRLASANIIVLSSGTRAGMKTDIDVLANDFSKIFYNWIKNYFDSNK
ncbi:MAG: hypothetical protein ACK5LP_04085 [Campylobacteraceae bacterium]